MLAQQQLKTRVASQDAQKRIRDREQEMFKRQHTQKAENSWKVNERATKIEEAKSKLANKYSNVGSKLNH